MHPSVPPGTLTPEIVAGAQRRDGDAIVALYRALSPAVYGYLVHQTRDESWAEDLTAEVFLEVLRAVERFVGTPEGLRAWVFRIAHNTLIDHFRKQSRRRHDSIEELIETDGLPASQAVEDPEAQAMSHLERERILAFVYELPADQRDVVLLRLVADLPISEVASLLDKSPGAVKALQHRAIRALAKRIQRPGPGDA